MNGLAGKKDIFQKKKKFFDIQHFFGFFDRVMRK
jgi:hypothetical protein